MTQLSAQNARAHGLRSPAHCPAAGEDAARLAALRQSVERRFAPGCPLEAAICQRIAIALWRAERADQLEAQYWNEGDLPPDHPARLIRTVEADQQAARSLATVLRYQADARNALSKALRDLERLRSGRLDRDPAAIAGAANENRTNEPPPPPAAPADRQQESPGRPAGTQAPFLNRHQRRYLAACHHILPAALARTDPAPG